MPKTKTKKRDRTGYVMVYLGDCHLAKMQAIQADWQKGCGIKINKSDVIRYALSMTYDNLPESSKIPDDES